MFFCSIPRRCLAPAIVLLSIALLTPSGFAAETAAAPRPGKYRIMSYGKTSSPPLFLGYFVLADNTYKAYLPGDKLSGEGRWKYDAASHTVAWESGPYAGVWGGKFTSERDGKTHKIRLKPTTIATNNTDG